MKKEKYESPQDEAKELCARYEFLKSERSNWNNHWDELSKYFLPHKDNIYGRDLTDGIEKGNHLYDSTSIHVNELLASSLHSMQTNAALKWFGLYSGIPEIDNNEDVKEWLQKSEDVVLNVLNNSNFQTEIHEIYIDLGGFGTAVLFIDEDLKRGAVFTAIPIYEVCIDEDKFGDIDTVFRTIRYTNRQVYQAFGKEKNFPKELMEDYEKKPHDKCIIVHCVYPDDEGSKWESVYILPKLKKIIKKSYYPEFPYAVPRWMKVSGEKYGRGPAMKSLPNVRMLNQMQKTLIRGAQKIVDPALAVTDDGSYRPIKITPSAINRVRAGTTIVPIETRANIPIGLEMIQQIRRQIESDFFIDQLQLQDGPQMTATEVRQRTEEKLRVMSPLLGRQGSELHGPTVSRTFEIVKRQGLLPKMSDKVAALLGGKTVRVKYVSTISRVQKTADADNLMRALAAINPVITAQPQVMDNINGDRALRHSALLFDVPQDILNKEIEVANVRTQRQQQQQQMMQQQQDTMNMEAAAKLGAVNG
jgi:hypothetical protein